MKSKKRAYDSCNKMRVRERENALGNSKCSKDEEEQLVQFELSTNTGQNNDYLS